LIRNAQYLHRVLTTYLEHYNAARPHRSLDLQTPLDAPAAPEDRGWLTQYPAPCRGLRPLGLPRRRLLR
jgi:hypothetical protein